MSYALLLLVLASPRVALVGGEARLEQAMTVSLAPWKVEVLAVPDSSPGSTMPEAQQAAEQVAAAHQAAAVVWTAGGDVLWIYDRQREQLYTRRMPVQEPDARAAAAALSVKTVLRSSDLAPPEERLVALRPAWLRLEAAGGARILSSTAEARFGGALSAWHRWYGAAVSADAGAGMDVSNAMFSGRFTDLALGATGRARWRMLEGALGPTVHLTHIDGTLAGARASARRTDVAVTATSDLEVLQLSRGSVGIVAGVDWFLRSQNYLAGEQSVFELPHVAVQFGLRVTAGLF